MDGQKYNLKNISVFINKPPNTPKPAKQAENSPVRLVNLFSTYSLLAREEEKGCPWMCTV